MAVIKGKWFYQDFVGSSGKQIKKDGKIDENSKLMDVLKKHRWVMGAKERNKSGLDVSYRHSGNFIEVKGSAGSSFDRTSVKDDTVVAFTGTLEITVDGKKLTPNRLKKIIEYYETGSQPSRLARVKKLSKEATLHLLLQGMWKGIQEAKNDPLVQAKYPRGLDFIERMVTDLGKLAKRDPNFRLTENQVRKLNQFLGGNSGVLSSVLRRHVVRHCTGNQCTMVSPNEFRFEYVEPAVPTYHVTGTLEQFDTMGGDDTVRIDQTVERLGELLDELKGAFRPVRSYPDREWTLSRGSIIYTQSHTNPRDVFDVNSLTSKLTLQINGNPLSDAMASKVMRHLGR